MSDTKINIRGIRELNRSLKQVDSQLPKQLKDEFKSLATDVAGKIQSKVPTLTGRARSSVKPRATSRGAGIAFGGSKAEYYPWLDFGGKVGRKKSIYRDFIKEGRYVYPTLREMNPEIADRVDKIIEEVSEKAGFDTKRGG